MFDVATLMITLSLISAMPPLAMLLRRRVVIRALMFTPAPHVASDAMPAALRVADAAAMLATHDYYATPYYSISHWYGDSKAIVFRHALQRYLRATIFSAADTVAAATCRFADYAAADALFFDAFFIDAVIYAFA